MIHRVIVLSIAHRWLVVVAALGVAALGLYNAPRLPIDAVPDITNVQVQVNTPAPGYSPLETEQRVTFAIETAMGGLPDLDHTRSLSRYGLSQVTVVFKDGTDVYRARNLVNERVQEAKGQLPSGLEPSLGPIATGLGEIFRYIVVAGPDARQPDGSPYDAMALRTVQDWIIRPQLRQVAGVTEVNSIGGYDRQYHVTPNPGKLIALRLGFADVVQALERNNASVGAGYIERNGEQFLIRAPGQLEGVRDIAQVVIAQRDGIPIRIGDVADVAVGRELRTGAATYNGQETVLGTALMLIGENSRVVAHAVSQKLQEIQRSLPDGVRVEVVYDRSDLVNRTIETVLTNLGEGAVLVIVVLLVVLGNLRAALVAALVIPLSMLFLVTGMVANRVSANLMSLGALDFGLLVDGAVIIVENCIVQLGRAQVRSGRTLTDAERFATLVAATREVARPSIVSVLVVLLVNVPIFALIGVEGKMFRPMAFTVVTSLIGALLFSLTVVPALLALSMRGNFSQAENGFSRGMKRCYERVLRATNRRTGTVVVAAILLTTGSAWLATTLGTEFVPALDEGDVVIMPTRVPGTGLVESLTLQQAIERAVLTQPEVRLAFSQLGTAEVANDPMPPSSGDGFVILKHREAWPDPDKPKARLLEELLQRVNTVPGTAYEMTQPIEDRFNELIAGVRADFGVKVFGDDMTTLQTVGTRIAEVVSKVKGVADLKVEQVGGLSMLTIEPRRDALSRYGLNVEDVQQLIGITLGGKVAGQIFEGDRRFDLVVRLPEGLRSDLRSIGRLPLLLPQGGYVPLAEVAAISVGPGPNQVTRENGKRRLAVTANVRGRDLGSFVADVQRAMSELQLPPGYWLEFGGSFKQLQSAAARLRLLVPLTLLMIFGLLLISFQSEKDAALVFSGVPLALTGGVASLWLRDIPLSITAGVGFITLSGVAVLTGVVMLSAFRDLRAADRTVNEAVLEGAVLRLRPILTIAVVAALGFLPMALNTGTGAEVQRPLATVVIGGILSSTLLTLVVLPALYLLTHREPLTGGTPA